MLMFPPLWTGDEFKRVHEDERGEIYILPLTQTMTTLEQPPFGWGSEVALDVSDSIKKDITLLRTKRGYARGGCIHELNDEYTVIIEGKINYFLDWQWTTLQKGQSILVPRGKPHMMVALEESITMEWGVTRGEKDNKDETMRKYVDKINKEANHDTTG